MLILAFSDSLDPSKRIAETLNLPLAEVSLHRFPDGESLVKLPSSLPEHVVICRSLNDPNSKLIELMLCAQAARNLGAVRVTLVAPYLCYMRQDIANQPGEAISQRIIGQFLAGLFNDVITVDPHLHRISTLQEAIPIKNALSLTAASEISRFLQKKFSHAVLLGPDSESEQWVAGIAKQTGFDYAIAEKVRSGDRDVCISLPDFDFNNQTVIIIDDMASTGRTMANTTRLLLQAGAKTVNSVITHPLFFGDAEAFLRAAGVNKIWSTDSIAHPTSVIQLHELLAKAIKSIA